MASGQIIIFGMNEDFQDFFSAVERLLPLRYYKTGQFDHNDTPFFDSLVSQNDIGFTKGDDWNWADSFLAQTRDTPLLTREIMQRTGVRKIVIDQLHNPDSVEVKPAGIALDFEKVIISGRIATVSTTPRAKEILKTFEKVIKKMFTKIAGCYVGPSALQKKNDGWRLVTNVHASREYDLK